MKFTVEPKIFEKFPGVAIGVLVITGMDNRGHNGEILKLLRDEERLQKEKLTGVEMGSLPEVSIWRKIYKKFGSDPRDFRSSVEALLRRARGGEKPMPSINNLVDIYNYVSLKYHLPVGAEDMDKVQGNIELAIARGTEKGVYLGSKTEETCYQGEVIYKDDKGFICRRWNWREAERTKIDFETKNAVLVIESAPGVDAANLESALVETATLISKYLSGKIQRFTLDHTNHQFDIDFQTGTKTQQPAQKQISQKKVKDAIVKPQSQIPALINLGLREDKNSVSFLLRQVILQALCDIFGGTAKVILADIEIEHPKIEDYGDYATNIAMRLAKQLKMKPYDIAKIIAEKVNGYIKNNKTITFVPDSKDSKEQETPLSEILESVDAKTIGTGFVNFKLKREYLISQILQLPENENVVGTTKTEKRKIMIEFAHPNTHKEFHIGHLRNIAIGESLVRMLESSGFQVFRANYEGDVGLHVAKAIWGIRTKIAKERLDIEQLKKLAPDRKAKFLGESYSLGSKAYDEDEKARKEIMALNLEIYEDPHKVDLWEETKRWSLEYFDTVYKRLGTHFDRLFFESEVEQAGRQAVIEAVKTGIFIKDQDGSIYFPGKTYGLNNCVFVTKEGYATYEGKEIALEELEYRTFPFDLDIHVVANEQRNFFQIAFSAVETLYPYQKGRQYHLAYGMVNLKGSKLSSRTGNVVTADELIDRAQGKIMKIIKEGTVKEKEEIAEKVAVAAVKYSMLRVSPKMDITFDLEESVCLEGDSGPYLQYTYARCKSVMRKAGLESLSLKSPKLLKSLKEINEEEQAILRSLYRFPEVVIEAARALSPSVICNYLYDLAQKYNLFYQKHPILNMKNETSSFRLFLTEATAKVVRKGLNLLGIETVEKM